MRSTLSAKEASLQLIKRLKDDVTYEDIMYELHVLHKIAQGLHDVEQGATTSHEDVKKEFEKWLTS